MKPDSIADIITGIRTHTLRTGEVVEVKELRWRDYMHAIRTLTGKILDLIGGVDGRLDLSKPMEIKLDSIKIIDAITSHEELATWVIMKSTGLAQETVDRMGMADMLAVLNLIVDLNLSEEVVGPAKKLAGRFGTMFQSATSSPAPATSSSPTATRSAT